MKKKSSLIDDDEISLIELFKIIWNGKIKILLITIFSFLLGYGYYYLLPKNYLFSLEITKENKSFDKINYATKRLLHINQIAFKKYDILNLFNRELQDKEEFLISLKKTKKFKENNSNLPSNIQKQELLKYVDLLKVVKKSNVIKLNLEWDNINEGKHILKETLNLTLNNIQKSIYEKLEEKLKFEKKLAKSKDFVQLEYLEEQRWIAKELDIINPTYGFTGAPYYLVGYVAIDKQIEVIKKRKYQKFELIKQEINFLKKNSMELDDDILNSTKVKNLSKKIITFVISIFLGLLIGIIFVLISNAIQLKTITKKRSK